MQLLFIKKTANNYKCLTKLHALLVKNFIKSTLSKIYLIFLKIQKFKAFLQT